MRELLRLRGDWLKLYALLFVASGCVTMAMTTILELASKQEKQAEALMEALTVAGRRGAALGQALKRIAELTKDHAEPAPGEPSTAE